MKRKVIIFAFFVFYNIITLCQESPHTITFFIKPFPTSMTMNLEKALNQKDKRNITDFDKVLKKIVIKDIPSHVQTGIYSTYAGDITFSDLNGEIIFPRKTPGPRLYFLITEDIQPVYLNPLNTATITGFTLNSSGSVEYYLIEKKISPETHQLSWHITQEQVPDKTKIPNDAIILFINPYNIVVPTGYITSTASENLVFPNIYIKENPYSAFYALHILKIRQFFSSIKFKYEFKQNLIQQKINPGVS